MEKNEPCFKVLAQIKTVQGGQGEKFRIKLLCDERCRNFISTAHVHDDVMGFECKRSSEKY